MCDQQEYGNTSVQRPESEEKIRKDTKTVSEEVCWEECLPNQCSSTVLSAVQCTLCANELVLNADEPEEYNAMTFFLLLLRFTVNMWKKVLFEKGTIKSENQQTSAEYSDHWWSFMAKCH